MSVVVSSVNYLFSRVIPWRGGSQVQRLNLWHLRWLNRGRVLQYFISLKEEIAKFLENEPVKLEELENEFWNHDVFLFCDITAQLNDLNIQLQQNDKLIFKMFAAVKTSRWNCNLKAVRSQKVKCVTFPLVHSHSPHAVRRRIHGANLSSNWRMW